jgi:hypothetical protein
MAKLVPLTRKFKPIQRCGYVELFASRKYTINQGANTLVRLGASATVCDNEAIELFISPFLSEKGLIASPVITGSTDELCISIHNPFRDDSLVDTFVVELGASCAYMILHSTLAPEIDTIPLSLANREQTMDHEA